MVDNSMDLHTNAIIDVSHADFDHPAALHVQTKAKHYPNSVL